MKNQRCQPLASLRNENAAPRLWARTMSKNGVTRRASPSWNAATIIALVSWSRTITARAMPSQGASAARASRRHQATVRGSPAPNRLAVQRPQIVGCAGSAPTSAR